MKHGSWCGSALLVLVLGVSACGVGTDPNDNSESPTPSESVSPTPTPQPNADYEVFQQILDGTLDAQEGLLTISRSGGWPIETTDGFVFARLEDGRGPYSLTGDHNAWTLGAMTNESGLWWTTASIDNPEGLLYKFVTAAQEYEADPYARAYNYDEYGQYSLVRPAPASEHLERWPLMTDGVVSPRTVRIWVPAQAATHQIYVHDGQNLFDPNAFYGGWKLQESLGVSTMAIGIDSNADRMYDYTHVQEILDTDPVGGGGDAYADFVQNYLRPFVEERYGTAPRVGVMGSSLGGLISFHIAQRHAGEYDFAASLSGTFWWGRYQAENESMIERYVANPPLGTALYLDSGGNEGSGCIDSDGDGIEDDTPDASDNYCENRQFADLLPTVGYTFDTDLWHWWEPDAPHNEAAWAARVFRPLADFESL